ncbi:hypothetical protein Ancab_025699 [Ancistrocladus abbreviatus]
MSMGKKSIESFISIYVLCFLGVFLNAATLATPKPTTPFPLYTKSRWIVDGSGQRVKLACINWASHLDAMVAEGLSHQPMDAISKKIVAMGFNCVRLTWPTFLAVNDTMASYTVRQSFLSNGLSRFIPSLQANNPSLVELPLMKAFQEVVSNLGENSLMVILDNHVSKPTWCCSDNDGNGFFGDRYFNPDLWLKGLTKMTTMFKGVKNVVGMSLRNELRGPRQNPNDWYRYMQQGAEAVHAANPDALVILSGLSYALDLSFLQAKQVSLNFTGKLVFEAHRYAFSGGRLTWRDGNPNEICGKLVNTMKETSLFLLEQGWPLFASEFGLNLGDGDVNGYRFFNCYLAIAAEYDFDWALWALAGSYYRRYDVIGLEETYGVLTWNWSDVRNPSFMKRLSVIQLPLQDPGLSKSSSHQVVFHPLTGLCISRATKNEPQLKLGPCADSGAWSYNATQHALMLIDGLTSPSCLEAPDGLNQPVKLGLDCSNNRSQWVPISDSQMHLSTKLHDGSLGCLDVDPESNAILTTACKCLSRDHKCDPASQWFKVISNTARSPRTT